MALNQHTLQNGPGKRMKTSDLSVTPTVLLDWSGDERTQTSFWKYDKWMYSVIYLLLTDEISDKPFHNIRSWGVTMKSRTLSLPMSVGFDNFYWNWQTLWGTNMQSYTKRSQTGHIQHSFVTPFFILKLPKKRRKYQYLRINRPHLPQKDIWIHRRWPWTHCCKRLSFWKSMDTVNAIEWIPEENV